MRGEDQMSDNQVCYTFDAAVEMAIQMENEGFRHYLAAIRQLTNKGAKELMRENALDELDHKHQLEKALLEGRMAGGGELEALIYAIHLEKEAVEFYSKVANGCAGAPMGNLFKQLYTEESRHLQSLEDLYEQHFMTEN
jgi:rubrerythrin